MRQGGLQVDGDVGVALTADSGSAVHIHVNSAVEKSPLTIDKLLQICDEANCKPAIQRISKAMFDSDVLECLPQEQLSKLSIIAEEIKSCRLAQDDNLHARFTREMDEYEEFFRRTGIRASKPERDALIQLMTRYPFNPKQLKSVWTKDVLVFSNDKLEIHLPRVEMFFGLVSAMASACFLILLIIKIMIVFPPFEQLLKTLAQMILFAGTFFISISHLVSPAYIGQRIKTSLSQGAKSHE